MINVRDHLRGNNNRQSRETSNTLYTRHKTNKTQSTTQYMLDITIRKQTTQIM